MINRLPRRTDLLTFGLCAAACTGFAVAGMGCSGEEEAPVAVAPPPPQAPPPPAAPSVTPIEQLMAEMNIDPRISLPEEKAPDNDTDRRAVLSFFDGFARGNDKTVQGMLPESDQVQLAALVESGVWKDTTARITKIDIQCGSSPMSDKCALGLVEVKGGGETFQPQLWTYKTEDEHAMFEAVACPPGIMDRLSGDWIAKWYEILEQEIALANQPDDEYMIAQRDLDQEEAGDDSSSPGPQKPGTLRSPNGAPQEAPGIPGGGDNPRGG